MEMNMMLTTLFTSSLWKVRGNVSIKYSAHYTLTEKGQKSVSSESINFQRTGGSPFELFNFHKILNVTYLASIKAFKAHEVIINVACTVFLFLLINNEKKLVSEE